MVCVMIVKFKFLRNSGREDIIYHDVKSFIIKDGSSYISLVMPGLFIGSDDMILDYPLDFVRYISFDNGYCKFRIQVV